MEACNLSGENSLLSEMLRSSPPGAGALVALVALAQ